MLQVPLSETCNNSVANPWCSVKYFDQNFSGTVSAIGKILVNKQRQKQQTFRCSKSIIETVKNVYNLFKVNNKDTSVLVSLLLTLRIYHIFSDVSIGDFKQVNAL